MMAASMAEKLVWCLVDTKVAAMVGMKAVKTVLKNYY